MHNHSTRFKLHNDQKDKTYLKHGTIWKKERVEMLPRLKNSWVVVVIWPSMLETDGAGGWWWWLEHDLWLNSLWRCSKQKSPLMELWMKQCPKCYSSRRMKLEMVSKWCPDDGTNKGTRGLLRVFLQKIQSEHKSKMRESESFFC